MAAMMDEEGGDIVLTAADVSGAAGGGGAADDAMVPDFPALTAAELGTGSKEYRRVRVPPHRLTPLRTEWNVIMQPVVEHLLLQIRYLCALSFYGARPSLCKKEEG